MSVLRGCALRYGVLPLLAVQLCAPVLFAATKTNTIATPEHRLPLEKYGFRPVTSAIIAREGYTMSTVDLLDDEHVLVTFNARKLIPRQADDAEGDQARLVKAVVLHLPDGRVVHETEWRMRDHNQYLWPMRHGYFLLRQGDLLSRVAPMRGFEKEPLLESKRPIELIELSPESDMLLVETSPERHVGDDPTVPRTESNIEGIFYSVREGATPTLHIRAVVQESKRFVTAFTARGFLGTVQEDREHWGFDFHPFGGKAIELAGMASTCQPHALFLTDATFVATGCRGGSDRRLLGGFDLLAQANWVFTVDDAPVWPATSTAPGSGRFALRTTMTRDGEQDTDHVVPEQVSAQQIRVYSFRNGTELLRVNVTPIQRPAQNFSLSPDGRRLAVLHDGDLELYRLPAQTAEELKDEKRAEAEVGRLNVQPEGPVEARPDKRIEP